MALIAYSDCAPIADRPLPFLSLSAIDRIGDAFCESAHNVQRVSQIQRYRSFRMRCLKTTFAIVDACHLPTNAAVSVRLKRLDSIRRKIRRSGANFTLGRLDDVVGVRVICEDLDVVRELSARIESSPYSYRTKNYIASPAATGYRGINHIMRFQQPITATTEISMRFELQVRTYLQHRWAVWSESHGEAVKLGMGASKEQERLLTLSEEIARWEVANLSARQIRLPRYYGGRAIAVCWRSRHGPVIPYYFEDEIQSAVDWLNYLEFTHPADRQDALLLVGVTQASTLQQLLQLTHPLFVGVRVLDPSHWMPTSSS